MTKTVKRLLSMLLALSIVFGFAVPATAAETEEPVETERVTASLEADGIELSFDMSTLWTDGDVEIDEENPAIITMTQELKNFKVLNAEGESVPLTEEEIQQILYLYQQYLDHWEANADLLGVQTPFFLSYNDKEDSLGILGEMLVMANIPLAAVRAGQVKASDITGMIQNFMYGDALGVQLYGNAIKSARDEVVNLIKESGAVTDVQKYLVINNWLAQNTTFDMSYIMNSGKEENEKPMIAENPVEHEHYDTVYDVIYSDYEEQLDATFRQQITDGLKAAMMVEFYKAAIQKAVYQQAYEQYMAENAPSEPEDTTPSEPEDTTPSEPEDTTPSQPEDTTPSEPEDTTPSEPEDTTPSQPEDTTPSQPEESTPVTPEANVEQPVLNAEGEQSELEAAADAYATAAAEAFLEENAEAIEKDPVGFVTNAFGEEAAAQFAQQWEGFWADCEKNGIPGMTDPTEQNPEGRVPLDAIVDQQMDTPQQDPMLQKPDGSYMTPNEAIPAFAAQAAEGLTDGVLNYWQGHHFGALGRGTAVCLGYTKAFTYLVQYIHPEIYGVNGANTDMSKAENWKDAADLYYDANGNLDINKDYTVDSVRITFDASVTMYGETEDNFNSDHFWNAVKVDGKWYYIDPCYTDVYTLVMMRDRVETDGYMNHLYFMFSHSTCAELYEGNYKEIKTLYANAATHTDYEDSWISRIKSNIYFDGGYAYYYYDSTDLVSLLEDYENDNLDEDSMDDNLYKVVRHKLDSSDAGTNGDVDYEELIQFNFQIDEDSDPVARVYDPEEDGMVENELLTKLYAQFEEDEGNYPSLSICMALYNGKIYFNLSNCILSYDLKTGAVVLVKEYNVIHGQRDDTNPFGGMAFSVVDSADKADFTVYNRPIAGMAIKEDGNMYVSIATNFAFISGKDAVNDQSSYGYEFEESNYNANYSTYGNEDNEGMYESFGYTKETNDNDEFMWSANFVETLSMSHLAGTNHSYEEVVVEASCNRNDFIENRCTTCGASEDGSRVEIADSAHDHHYVYFEEQFYTKNDNNGNWNTGFCYVCTECNFAITEPEEPKENSMGDQFGVSYEEQMEEYEKEKAIYDHAVEIAGHVYTATDAEWAKDASSVTFSELICSAACAERRTILDCLLKDKSITASLEEEVTADAAISGGYGDCTEGATAIYTASGEAEGYKYAVSTEVELEAGVHPYVNAICAACGDAYVTRISGSNRYKTALQAADYLKATMGVEKFENIVVACGTDYADALSGSYLANKKNAPILLVNKNTVESVAEYIIANLAEDGTVYILGGESAVPATLDEALGEEDIKPKRLAGSGRYDTNLLILKEAGVTKDEAILVCTGNDYADALSASATGMPILLVNKNLDKLRDDQKEFLEGLEGNKLYIIGGSGAVSENIAKEVEAYGTYKRLAGSGRYETSVLIAQEFFKDPTHAVLAYGHNFPDGLCGGALGYYLDAPVILTRDKTKTYAVDYANEGVITRGIVLGGTSLISDETVKEIFQMAETDQIADK